jgi:hypothetical protein
MPVRGGVTSIILSKGMSRECKKLSRRSKVNKLTMITFRTLLEVIVGEISNARKNRGIARGCYKVLA